MKKILFIFGLVTIILLTACGDVKVTESEIWNDIVNKEWSAGLRGFYFHEEQGKAYCTYMIYGSGIRVIDYYKSEVDINEEGEILISLPEYLASLKFDMDKNLDLVEKILKYDNNSILFDANKFEDYGTDNNFQHLLEILD